MASIISAGTTSGTALNMAGDTSGVLQLATNGSTTAITVDTSQNVGIGTTSPAQLLEVKKDQATSTRIKVTNKTNNAAATAGLLFENSTSDLAYVQLWDAGSIGALTAYGLNMEGAGAGGANLVASNASGVIRFATGGTTERMRIDSSGNLLVNLTSQQSSGKFCVNFDGATHNGHVLNDTGSAASIAYSYFLRSGTLKGYIGYTTGSNLVSYNTTSDYRLKENIVPLPNALDTVMKLKPSQYSWKENGYTTTGFIAHELAEVVPDCVTGEKDAVDADGNPQYQGIDTSFLVATLTAAIQEMKAIIDAQAIRIETLEAK